MQMKDEEKYFIFSYKGQVLVVISIILCQAKLGKFDFCSLI